MADPDTLFQRAARLKADGKLVTGELAPLDDKIKAEPLRVVNDKAEPTTITVLTIENPGITAPIFALSGQIRYENVEGKAYVEMWSHFADGSAYFSRTLAQTGPMQELSGTSVWRPVTLPFDATGASTQVAKLIVNVALPGKGTVYLSPLTLTQQNATANTGAWWDNRGGGIVGGILGVILGCLGAAAGVLSAKGEARGFVTGALKVAIVCGVASLIAGCIALSQAQPYAVYYPLLLLGVLATVLPATLLPTVRKRYEEIELRKMRAHDA